MDDVALKAKLDFYSKAGLTPAILLYGDRVWKRGWLGFQPVAHPNGEIPQNDIQPKFKSKIGSYVTQSEDGTILPGVGAIAANLTEIDGNPLDNLKLIFNAEPKAEGVVFLDKNGEIMDWIARDDIPSL